MNAQGFLILITLFGVSIYDFYLLKKSKVKLTSCLSSSLITFVVNFFVMAIAVVISDSIFGDDSPITIPLAIISILGLSYFRFKGREIVGGKVKKEKEKEKKLSEKEKTLNSIDEMSTWGYVIAVLTTIYILFTINTGSLFTGGGENFIIRLIDPLLIAGIAFWISKKKTFLPCLLLTVVFIVGKLMMFIPLIQAGYTGGGGMGLTIIISYFLIKGTFASYKYNFSKK